MLFLPWVASTQAVRNDLSRSLLTCILILYRVIWYLSYIDILVYTWWIAILYIFMLNKFCLSPEVQTMACCLVAAKPLSEPMLDYCYVLIKHMAGCDYIKCLTAFNAFISAKAVGMAAQWHGWPCTEPGGHLNIKMSSYQYRDPHVKGKTV